MASGLSPISSICRLSLYSKNKPLKVMVLGQTGVGKTALVVRFITKRFIGEYDPTLEKIYTFHTILNNEDMVNFEILDTAGDSQETGWLTLESNIRWAEVFILVYSVTDKCSFDECNRLKFLINYNKRRKKLGSSNKDTHSDVPVALVGNKNDLEADRMVSLEEGKKRSQEIGCVFFHEISVRESIEQVWAVFSDLWAIWKMHMKLPKLKRSCSEMQNPMTAFHNSAQASLNRKSIATSMLGRRWTEIDLEEDKDVTDKNDPSEFESGLPPFRTRASTESQITMKSNSPTPLWQISPVTSPNSRLAERRMSIAMKGDASSSNPT